MRRFKIGRAVMATALSGMLLTLLPANPASAVSYSGTETVYLKPSVSVDTPGVRERLGYVKVPSPGTYRATLSTDVKDSSSDPVQLVTVSLICKEETTIDDQIGTSANVSRGETINLTTRVHFKIKKRGACFAYGTTTKIRPSSSSPSAAKLYTRSTLTITGPISDGVSETKRFVNNNASGSWAGKSSLAKRNVQFHAGELSGTTYGHARAQVTANLYLTTCSFIGGSRDQTTGGKNLCTRSVVDSSKTGTLLQTRLVVRQYTPGGAVCGTSVVPGSTTRTRITANRHHQGVSLSANFTPLKSTCGTRLRAWTEVKVLDGPPVVVHFPNTSTAYVPL